MRFDEAGPVSRRALLTALMAMSAAACSKLSFVAANLPAAFGAYSRRTMSYGAGAAHDIDVYVPDVAGVGPRPVVVFWYGGRWSSGDKADYRFVGAALAQLGCVAMLPNYRHYPAVKLAGFMDDAARAAVWAYEHAVEFGGDPQRFYLLGHSAGAHMATLVSLDTRYFAATGRPAPQLKGVIGLSGPYDFLPLTDADLQDMFGPPARYELSQPIHFASAQAPPMLLVQGLGDRTVWPKNAINLSARLKTLGVSVELKLYPQLGHADTVAALSLPARSRAPTLTDIAAFLNLRVSPPPSS